jgi:hypothetical protein
VSLLIHAAHVGLVVLVPVLQSLVAVTRCPPQLCLLRLLQRGDGAQLVEDLMFALQAQSRQEVLEVLHVEVPLPFAVDGRQQTADLLGGDLPLLVGHEGHDVLAGDGFAVGAELREDLHCVEVEGAEEGLVQLHKS